MAKTKKWLEKYDEIKMLGSGGNADVYLVREKYGDNQYALKELRNRNEEKKSRFLSEIKVAEKNADTIPGIIPIIEKDEAQFWYTMPVAIPIMDAIEEMNILERITGIIQLSETLEQLHEKRIYHRDIKPSNVYWYRERFCFGDFGLVDFPDNPNLTQSDKRLGAIFTIAPEMKRNPKQADASKADVFSLAKTMWMILSGDEKGFDGEYNYFDESYGLRYISKYQEKHLVEIEEVLRDATRTNPSKRPDISEFKEQLIAWKSIFLDRTKSQNSEWLFLKNQIFAKSAPSSAIWRNTDEIIEILNIIGKTPAYNHMLFSDGGGLDFSSAEKAAEEECIYLYTESNGCFVVKPKRLIYEGFEEDVRWNYFLLELEDLSVVNEKNENVDCESLVEDTPGHYVDASCANYGVYNYDSGERLPDGYRVIKRYLHGKMLIVLKSGLYNKIQGTYDGRHGQFSSEGFRAYVKWLCQIHRELHRKAQEDEDFNTWSMEEVDRIILENKIFNDNPLKGTSKRFNRSEERQWLIQENIKKSIENKSIDWDYSDAIIEDQNYTNKIKYYFILDLEKNKWDKWYSETKLVLTKDGKFREEKIDSAEIFYVYSREAVTEVQRQLQKIFCQNLNLEEDLIKKNIFSEYVSVELLRNGKPSHLFTKDEIENEMRHADDRKNNILVIDEEGYAKVLVAEKECLLYPVSHETWCAGNNYVGKYSKLDTLNDSYISSLQGWLEYLTCGDRVYIRYMEKDISEEDLLREIEKYY